MKIFVTGGTGFIGLPAVLRLANGGHNLLLLSEHPEKHKKFMPRGRKISFVRGNLSDIGKWERRVRDFRPDAALHMAWEGIPDYGAEMSARNLVYGLELFKMLCRTGCRKIVTTGSCWEYGAESGKLSEEMPVRPKNAFAAAKDALRQLGGFLAKENGAQFIWTRLFYVYGPRQKASSLIPHLVRRAEIGAAPDIKNPKGGNDFVYVGDVARAIALVVTKRAKEQVAIYNIGSGKITGNQRIVNEVYGMKLGREPKIIKSFYADISKIKRDFGYSPVDIEKGIRLTIEKT